MCSICSDNLKEEIKRVKLENKVDRVKFYAKDFAGHTEIYMIVDEETALGLLRKKKCNLKGLKV